MWFRRELAFIQNLTNELNNNKLEIVVISPTLISIDVLRSTSHTNTSFLSCCFMMFIVWLVFKGNPCVLRLT